MCSCSTWAAGAHRRSRAAHDQSDGTHESATQQIPKATSRSQYTGLRAAEKLFEELLIGTNVTGTDHPMILRAMEHSIPWERMQQLLNELLIALASFDCRRAVALLAESVAEYRQSHDLRDFAALKERGRRRAGRSQGGGLRRQRRLS